jgi:Major Facilitator Superfamily
VLFDQIGWRALFVINVPFGAAILYGARQIPKGGGEGGLPDALGTLLLGAGVGAAALGISQGRDWGWGDPRTLVTIIGGVLAAAAAIQRSRHHPRPALETKLWRSKAFATANVASLLYGAALFPWMLVGVLVQVTLWDYSPLQAGLGMTPGAIVAAIVAMLAARKTPKPIILGGAILLAAAGAILTLALPADPNFLGFWLPVGVLIGAGMGAITTGVSTAAALSVTPERFAAAVGLNSAARQVGGALGVAALAGLIGTDIASFKDIYLFCTLATLGLAITGSRL